MSGSVMSVRRGGHASPGAHAVLRRVAAVALWCLAAIAEAHPAVAGQVPPAATAPLTLQQAIDEALAHNPELRSLEREYERARLVPDTAAGFEPPMFEAQIWRWPINTLNPANVDMYMFSLRQALPGRGTRAREADVARADAAVVRASMAARARAIVDEIKQAWAELYVVRKAIETNASTIVLFRQASDIAAAKYSAGSISQQDVLAGVVELSRLHEERVRLGEEEALAAAMLNTLLDRAPEQPVGALAEPVDVVSLPPTAELQALALAHEPGLVVAGRDVERAHAVLSAAKASYGPDFQITGGYMLSLNMTDAWMAGVSVSWPGAPWSRGRLDAEQAVAAAAISASEARRQSAENSVRLAVHQAYLRVMSAGERASLLASSVLPQAEQAVAVARANYETDRASFLSLIDSQRVLLAAKLDYYRARAARAQAIADLERAVGVDFTPAGTVGVPLTGGLER